MVVLSTLAVEGAILAYNCTGAGPFLLTIPGANGDAVIFSDVAPYLAQNFTVCTYDRRGYTNSTLTAPADLTTPHRLQRDADDAAALIAHLSPSSPGLVFGTSSGAIVGMELLQRHPGAVDLLVAHEPPLSYALGAAAGAAVEAVFAGVYDTYLAEGVDEAAAAFVGNGSESANPELYTAWHILTDADRAANANLFFQAEIANYTAVNESIDALVGLKDQLVFDIGEACVIPSCNISEALAEQVGVALYTTPGGHLGYVSEPEGFSQQISNIFAENGRL